MPFKYIEVLTRPSNEVSWKNPDRIDEWRTLYDTAVENGSWSESNLQQTSEYSEDECSWTDVTIYESIESEIRMWAFHSSLTELRADQQAYRDRVGITYNLTIIDADSNEEIPLSVRDAKIAELKANGFDPYLP
jgi:hypothetical protein